MSYQTGAPAVTAAGVAGGVLASTGFNSVMMIAVACALIVSGLLMTTRRRRDQEDVQA